MSLKSLPGFLLNFSQYEMNGKKTHSFLFRSFRLDVGERRLLDDGVPVQLTPKMFDVLIALVERSGHLVAKDELMELVWADSYVEEANIARVIHMLRKALGEDDHGNRFIETVAKSGYRFVADVRLTGESNSSVKVNDGIDLNSDIELRETEISTVASVFQRSPQHHETLSQETKPYGRALLAAICFLIVIASSLILLPGSRFEPSSVPHQTKSITVLPFRPLMADNREPIYELGITEQLILSLGSAKSLQVRPLSASRKYSDVEIDPIEAGRELNVDYVFAANYQIANGKVRVTGQLIDVSRGQIENLYKNEFDAGDVFTVQDRIASEIGLWLLTQFGAAPGDLKAQRGTANEEAYRLYLQGVSLTLQRKSEDTKIAIGYLEKAVSLDPKFAKGHAGLAQAYVEAAVFGGADPRVEIEKANLCLKKAFELDADLSEAHAVRGHIEFAYEWNFAAAERSLVRAIELKRNNDHAHWAYALVSCFSGNFDRALSEIDEALLISPSTVMYNRDRGRILYYARRYDEAIAQFKHAVDLGEEYGSVWGHLWLAYEMKGDDEMAYNTFIKRQIVQNKEFAELYQKAYESKGWPGVREKLLEVSLLNENEKSKNFYAIARQYVQLGDKENAFRYLNKAFDKKQVQMAFLKVDPPWDPLRDDRRFVELVRRVGIE